MHWRWFLPWMSLHILLQSTVVSDFYLFALMNSYNCTNTFKDYSEKKEDNRFLIISKDLLKQRVFSGSGLFGRITVSPMSNVVLASSGEDVKIIFCWLLIGFSLHYWSIHSSWRTFWWKTYFTSEIYWVF